MLMLNNEPKQVNRRSDWGSTAVIIYQYQVLFSTAVVPKLLEETS